MTMDSTRAAGADEMKRALLAIRDLRRRIGELESGAREPVAIVGMSCRFPGGASSPERYWELLRNGVDATTEVPADRWDAEAFYDPDPEAPGRAYVRRGGFLQEPVDRFDAGFFGISTREADAMDPLHRMLLELSWEALEHAAIAPHRLEGSDTGVFIGISGSDYGVLQQDNLADINSYRGTGAISSVAAGRISHFLGTHGPNVALDTACSSALVALALAVDAVRNGRCSLALAGTSHLMLAPVGTIMLCKLRALSADGRCRTFDAGANGYARAEGGGMFVLKKLSAALADGDPVLAVIRAAAVNHDGRSSGLTVPNAAAQRAVIEAALREAGLPPSAVSYVEAHGTATPLGDPIELRALGEVLGRQRDRPLLVGSCKTNVGHLEPAAGAAGLAKVVLSLQHRQIPPSLHMSEPTPHVHWADFNMRVPTALTEWHAEPRIAGISGFGFSGTNAHVLVEEAPARAEDTRERRPAEVIVISGRSAAAVRELAGRYSEHVGEHGDVGLPDLAATTTNGRAVMPFRATAVGASADELRAALDAIAAGDDTGIAQVRSASAGPVAMMFTGQGAQHPGMAKELWETSPVFRRELERCAAILAPHMDRPLLPLVLDAAESDALRQTQYTQPALFSVEYALAVLWRSWGVEPGYVLGHSLGEYVAATVAGVFTLEDALPLVALRGRLMQQLPSGGRMAAVFAPEQQVIAAMTGETGVAIAAVNAPNSIVVSGRGDAVQRVLERLSAAGVQSKDLEVSHAFHSPDMEPILDEFERAVGALSLHPPAIPVVSNLTGTLLTAREAVDPSRWRRHLREPVRFSASMEKLAELGVRSFIEAGPHPVLCGLGAQTITAPVAWVPSLRRNVPAWHQLGASVGELFRHGRSIDFDAWGRDYAGRRSPGVPSYAFQRERHWFSDDTRAATTASPTARVSFGAPVAHPLLGASLRSPLVDGWVFQTGLAASEPRYLTDHRVQDRVVVPAAAYLEMMTAAAAEGPAWPAVTLTDVGFGVPLILDDDGVAACQVLVGSLVDGAVDVRIVSTAPDAADPQWTTHAHARARVSAPTGHAGRSLSELRNLIADEVSVPALYERLQRRGITYGPAFRGLEAVWTAGTEALGRARLPASAAAGHAAYTMHPCLLDLSFQILESTSVGGDTSKVFLPFAIDEIRIDGQLGSECWIHAALRGDPAQDPDLLSADIELYDANGRRLVALHGFRARRIRANLGAGGRQKDVYDVEWAEVDAPVAPPATLNGAWLILDDAADTGLTLAEAIEKRGGRCVRVRRGRAAGRDDVMHVDPARQEDWVVVADAVRTHGELQGVVHLWSLEEGPDATGAADDWLQFVLDTTTTVPTLLQRDLLKDAPFGLRVVTRGATGPGFDTTRSAPAGAAMTALLRVLRSEHPDLACRAVDLDPRGAGVEADALIDLLFGTTVEDCLVARDDVLYAPRLVRHDGRPSEGRRPIPAGESYRIAISQRGTLDALHYVPAARRAPGPNEVEVRVQATGLNFRDVLNVLGIYRGAAGAPGVEFAGVVTRIGDGVTHVAPGDEVIGIGEGTFAGYVTGPAAAVTRKPAALSVTEAVTIPLAFLTAEWGLADLAALQPGERVLIHAAAGGVGQAAVHLALARGAEVFATAGSEEKRAYLRAQGVQHVFDSRSAGFAKGVRAATNGEGVDVVLNSLTGELLQHTLMLMRPGGRFIEIGKAEILEPEEVSSRSPANVSYHAFDLGTILIERPATFQALFERVTARFASGELKPIATRVYPAEQVVDAFRHMAQARHIGKVVVTAARPRTDSDTIRSDAAYLVTGAAGGVGRRVVQWLVEQGAGAVYLNGRSEPDADLAAWMERLRADGTSRIEWIKGDVASAADAGRIVEHARTSAALRGVFHAAGALDDGLLYDQNRTRFARVMASKVAGTMNLHALTLTLDLDHFVLFSSVAAIMGGPGQGNYAAANAFMDAVAEHRRRQGLAALSVNWGAWAADGMAARMTERERSMLAERGLGFLEPSHAVATLDSMMATGVERAIVLEMDWRKVATNGRSVPPLLSKLVTAPATSGGAAAARGGQRPTIDLAALAELEGAERRARVSHYLRATLGSVLGVRGRDLQEDAEIGHLGFDSLMAMEFRNRVEADLTVVIPVARLLSSPTAGAVVDEVMATLPDAEAVRASSGHGALIEGEL